MINMPKEKISNEESKQVAGGVADNDKKSLEELFGKHRSGPYKCWRCGKEYYLGDEEFSRDVCLDCWKNPKPLF